MIHTSMSTLYKQLGVLKLHDLYYYNLALMTHDYYHSNTLPIKLAEKYVKKNEITEKTTRNNELELYYPTPRLSSTFRKPSVASASVWNLLPQEIKSIRNKNSFKLKLKQYLINKY